MQAIIYWLISHFFNMGLFSSSAHLLTPSNDDCNKFHNGTFFLRSEDTRSFFIITRKDSIQSEEDKNKIKLGTYVVKVKWITPCRYEVIPVADAHKDSLPYRPLQVNIVKTTNDYYIFEARMKGIDLLYSDTMVIVK